jgi:hypothetical protein
MLFEAKQKLFFFFSFISPEIILESYDSMNVIYCAVLPHISLSLPARIMHVDTFSH